MNVPTFATHYYLPESGPLRSLSDLPLGSEDPVFEGFLNRHKSDASCRRRFGKEYLNRRRVIEDRLWELFITRGGKPKRRNPFYFVRGDSPWFRDLNAGHEELRINLSRLDPERTSLTYPDSFIALTQDRKPYHQQIFLLHELEELQRLHGLPQNDHLVPYERYWETDFELYIEIQVWDDAGNPLNS